MEKSPLGKLPAELRKRIYKYVFVERKIYLDKALRICETHPEASDHNMLSLTTTCRAIREESVELFYANTAFSFDTSLGNGGLRDGFGGPRRERLDCTGFERFCTQIGPKNSAAMPKKHCSALASALSVANIIVMRLLFSHMNAVTIGENSIYISTSPV